MAEQSAAETTATPGGTSPGGASVASGTPAAPPAGQAGGPSAAGGATPPAASPATAPTDLFAGLDPELRQVAQVKGWKSLADPVRGYASLEKALGADKLPLPPKGADGNRDWSQWDGWQALGRPEKADDYTFAAPEGREFNPVDDTLLTTMRPVLHEAGLAQFQVDKITKGFQQHALAIVANAEKMAAADRSTLEQEWGGDFDRNIELANRVVRTAFGDDMDAAKRIMLGDGRFLLDDARLARAFAKLGALVAEDGALAEGAARPGMPASPAAASAEIDRIRGEAHEDPKHAYNDAKHPEHQALQARVLDLYKIAGRK